MADLTQWHPAFVSATKLELRDNKEDLTFSSEVGLNTKPIMVDLLVITKSPDVIIKNELGKIFKGHNLFEYKSPYDELNIDTFYKGIAYASLYKSKGSKVDSIKPEDITLSFVRDRKPHNLFKRLKSLDYGIRQETDGIYYIDNCIFGIQIIVTSELNPSNHIWLASLTDKLSEENAKILINEAGKIISKDDKEASDSVLEVTISQNAQVFEYLKEEDTMCKAIIKLFQEEYDAGINAIQAEKDAEIENLKAEKDAEIENLKAEIAALKLQLS